MSVYYQDESVTLYHGDCLTVTEWLVSVRYWHGGMPGLRVGDLDKHVRTILDALTAANVIVDDRLVVHIDASKRWCLTGEKPGATITVREAL